MEPVEFNLDHAQPDLSLHHGLGLPHSSKFILFPCNIFLQFNFFLFHDGLVSQQLGDEHFEFVDLCGEVFPAVVVPGDVLVLGIVSGQFLFYLNSCVILLRFCFLDHGGALNFVLVLLPVGLVFQQRLAKNQFLFNLLNFLSLVEGHQSQFRILNDMPLYQ